MSDGLVRLAPALHVPPAEFRFRASRAGGPGGQHVNTSSTRIELLWDVAHSPSLTDEQRARLLERLAPKLDARGTLRIVAAEERSQLQNREAAVKRLVRLVTGALKEVKPRRPTRPTRGSVERRLAAKKQRSAVKQERRRRSDD